MGCHQCLELAATIYYLRDCRASSSIACHSVNYNDAAAPHVKHQESSAIQDSPIQRAESTEAKAIYPAFQATPGAHQARSGHPEEHADELR
jgi:hypothetical protein